MNENNTRIIGERLSDQMLVDKLCAAEMNKLLAKQEDFECSTERHWISQITNWTKVNKG